MEIMTTRFDTHDDVAVRAYVVAWEAGIKTLRDGQGTDAARTAAWNAAKEAIKGSPYYALVIGAEKIPDNAYEEAYAWWLAE